MEDNKLIAEYMDRYDLYNGMSDARAKRIYKYHTSWNWLWTVINKCYHENMSKRIAEAVKTNDISIAYGVVVEFIKDYNQNK